MIYSVRYIKVKESCHCYRCHDLDRTDNNDLDRTDNKSKSHVIVKDTLPKNKNKN
jgi:hypothetical protein